MPSEQPAPDNTGAVRITVEQRRSGSAVMSGSDTVVVEEPLEIAIEGNVIAVVMRTPGNDRDLVRGFLLTEAIVLRPQEVVAVEFSDEGGVSARLAPGVEIDHEQFRRSMFTSSSCGVCGKNSIEAVMLHAPAAETVSISTDVVAQLTDQLRSYQPLFDMTGGLHAAGIFSLEGKPLVVREDIGRHNAVDKAIGAFAWEHTDMWPPEPALLTVSGRQSFEIIQKAAMARLTGVVGVSAPSSLAVQLAQDLGLLLVGFSREGNFNIYSGADRLIG